MIFTRLGGQNNTAYRHLPVLQISSHCFRVDLTDNNSDTLWDADSKNTANFLLHGVTNFDFAGVFNHISIPVTTSWHYSQATKQYSGHT